MEVVVLTEMSRTGQIIQMWQSTGAWDKLKPQKREAITASLKKVMAATENDYNVVMWMARCIQRGLLLALNKTAKLKQALNDENPTNRIYNDFNFFVGSEASAFADMFKNIRETAKELEQEPVFHDVPDIRNGEQQFNADGTPKMRRERVDLLKILGNVKYTQDVKTTQGTRQLDRAARDVYDDINGVMKSIGEAGKLPKGERITTMNDGSYWTFVDAKVCKIEGSLMGHCGNAAANPNDAIISLRIKKAVHHEPYATFIYDKKDNVFGEMKGRHNKKPSNHLEQIVELLSKPSYDLPVGNFKLQYLRGGGYAAQQNFTLNDLPEMLFKQLCKTNAALIDNQVKNAANVSIEQKLDAQHLKWANEASNASTIKYMQD
jgi:hypothetical protein